jgi:hypothetical protein
MISGLDGSLWEPKQLLAARLDVNLSAADLVWHLGRGSEPSRRTQQEEGASRHRDSDRCRSGATPPAAADRILPPPAVCPASRTGGLNAASIIPSGVPEPQPGPGRRRPARLNLRRHLPLESALLLPAAAILDFGPPHPRI